MRLRVAGDGVATGSRGRSEATSDRVVPRHRSAGSPPSASVSAPAASMLMLDSVSVSTGAADGPAARAGTVAVLSSAYSVAVHTPMRTREGFANTDPPPPVTAAGLLLEAVVGYDPFNPLRRRLLVRRNQQHDARNNGEQSQDEDDAKQRKHQDRNLWTTGADLNPAGWPARAPGIDLIGSSRQAEGFLLACVRQ